MKLLITTLTLMFISFGAFAKDQFISCVTHGDWKLSSTFLGKHTLYLRSMGKWDSRCSRKGDQVYESGAKCDQTGVYEGRDQYVVDFKYPKFQWYNKGEVVFTETCF